MFLDLYIFIYLSILIYCNIYIYVILISLLFSKNYLYKSICYNFSEFYINEENKNGFPNLINLIGIDSPGLTASLAIGELVVQTIIPKMNL